MKTVDLAARVLTLHEHKTVDVEGTRFVPVTRKAARVLAVLVKGANYLFTTEEKQAFIALEPASEKWFRRWLGADEFINRYERWCLWLGDASPTELRAMPEAMKRVQAVKAARLASKSSPTRKLADTPTRFHVENIPSKPYLAIPEVSSERREYIPLGYLTPETLASNKLRLLPEASLSQFGVLQSSMHMAWMRATCGRLESRYQYSIHIVYNNFPWPDFKPNQPQSPVKPGGTAIEIAAQAVLDARAQFPDASLADLYDPLAMPAPLVRAHQALDRAVDAAYGYKGSTDDAARVAFLFGLYQQLTAATAPVEQTTRAKNSKARSLVKK